MFPMLRPDKKLNNILIRYFVLVICITVSILTIDFSNHYFKFLFLLPLLYGILFVFIPQFLNGMTLKTPGFFILNLVMIFRYLVLPLALKYGGYYRDVPTSHINSINAAILLMIVELLTIGICIYFFSKIYKLGSGNIELLELENPNKKQKNFLILVALASFLLIILSDTSILNRFSFISIEEGYSHHDRNEQISAGTLSSLALNWFRLLFPIYWIKICKDLYSKTNKIYWAYVSTLVPVLSLLFFSGMSRSSILIPALVLCVILGRTFPMIRRKMYTIILSTCVFSVTVLTIFKTFNTSSVSEGFSMMDMKWLSNTLEAYFGGVYNVAIAIDTRSVFNNDINVHTLLSDLFSSWMGIGALFRDHYSTSEFFNIVFYGGNITLDQVVPTIGSSYLIFGMLGSMIFTIAFVWLICLFEKMYQKESTIELAYLYGFSTIQCAFNLPGNFSIICSYLLNTFIPLYLLFKLNELIILKRKQ